MKLLLECAPGITAPQDLAFSSILEENHALYALLTKQKKLFIFQNQVSEVADLAHEYSNLTFDPDSQTFFAIGCRRRNNRNESVLYLLDSDFREIDENILGSKAAGETPGNIWFDKLSQLLFLVSPSRIQRFNCNGDFLCDFMKGAFATRYLSVCTFRNFVFVSYEKHGCLYVASYTCNGVFLERVAIGNDFRVCNMWVSTKEECPLLILYGIKKCYIPALVHISLEGHPVNLQVQLICEDDSQNITCHVN